MIFCYSGTGDLARNIARRLGDAEIIMIGSEPAVTDVRKAERVGFVFPCYGGGAPEDVLKHAAMIRVSPAAYTFGVCMCAVCMGTGVPAQSDHTVRVK